MAHDLDESLGFPALAFTGSRDGIWHKLGQSIDLEAVRIGRALSGREIFALAGCAFTVRKVALEFPANGEMQVYPDRFAHVRNDTHKAVGMGSEGYQLVQPDDLRMALEQYQEVDPRFEFTTVGALNGGKRIWAQLRFNGDVTIGGDAHKAHLLASTSFDAGSSTTMQGSVTRVVCKNTIQAAFGEKAPVIRMRHSGKFDAERARRELAAICKGFDHFKAMGDALASHVMGGDMLSAFLRDVLDIPADAKCEEVSTRKKNQRQSIINAMLISATERNVKDCENIDAFTALQGVTRYVDHERDADDTESRLFGSGAALKAKAMGLLMPLIKDMVAA